MKTNLVISIQLLFTAFAGTVADAQPVPILEAYIESGLANNLALQQQNLDVQRSLEAMREARSLFYPTVQFKATYTRSAGGRDIAIPVGDLLNPVYTTLNQLTQTNQFPQISNVNERFLPDNFHETYLNVTYPLFNSDLKYNRQIKQHQVQSKTAQKAAYEHALRYQITEAYLQYLKALEAEKIWINAQKVLRELRRFNQSLVDNDVATRDVVATADYELSKVEHEIYSLQSQQNSARAYFNFLLNRDLQEPVIIDTTLLAQSVRAYDRADMIRGALGSRHEPGALLAGQAAAETAVRLNEAKRMLPEVFIGGQLGFQGFGYKFNEDQMYGLVQVGLNYTIFNGNQTKSKIQQARIESEKLRQQHSEVQQQITLQVTQAWNELENARNAWTTAQQGRRAAAESFRIINNKYRANQALLVEFLDAENRLTTAELQVLLAWSDVLIKEAALQNAAGQ
ncbi:MAG: TolC family protein [Saprospiraceae bacterium]|nr:TolC family protein [Lewinellaceae bacterium]